MKVFPIKLACPPLGDPGSNVSALSAFGPSERCFPVQADDSPMRCAA